MAEMRIRMMPVDDLIPYEKNPRRNDKAVDVVAKSIQEFGFRVPIIVDADNVIVCGHTRRLAAMKLGLAEVPVVVADDLTPEQIRAYRLADNRVTELAEWDENLLKEELAKIKGIDLSSLGFDKEMLEDMEMHELGIKRHVCPRCGAEWTE